MPFWCQFLDSHDHLNIGVHITVVFNLGMSTLNELTTNMRCFFFFFFFNNFKKISSASDALIFKTPFHIGIPEGVSVTFHMCDTLLPDALLCTEARLTY